MNIIEGIQEQCNRVRELIPVYESIGSCGAFAVTMFRRDIAEGEAAIASGDVVRMLAAYISLECCKG